MPVKTSKKSVTEEVSRILIVDDNETNREFLVAQLKALGFNVVAEAATGEEAVALNEECKPDLVIMDIKMPKMDGIEAAKVMTLSKPVPVILITGYSSKSLVDRAIESGVFAYILKPVTKKDLLPAIGLAIARFKEFTALKAEVGSLKDAIETRKLVERAKGILMKRLNIPEDEAFRLLQTQSQKENRKLKHIAETIITASKMI